MNITIKISLIISITLVSFSYCFSQKQSKIDKISEKLIGSWKFDYAVYMKKFMTVTMKDTSRIFHTDTIHFYSNKTFKFNSHDSKRTSMSCHEGQWKLNKRGKLLILFNRKITPNVDEQIAEVLLPIKIVNNDILILKYTTYSRDDESSPNYTPVFFNKLK